MHTGTAACAGRVVHETLSVMRNCGASNRQVLATGEPLCSRRNGGRHFLLDKSMDGVLDKCKREYAQAFKCVRSGRSTERTRECDGIEPSFCETQASPASEHASPTRGDL